jgi:hypothetical protein
MSALTETRAYARRAGFEIAGQDWFYDAAVDGADPIEDREGFARLLDSRVFAQPRPTPEIAIAMQQ